MNEISRRTWLGMTGAAAAAGIVGWAALSRDSGTGHGRKHRRTEVSAREAIRRHNLPNVALVTHEGKHVRFYDDLIKDKFVTLNMIYTSCRATCPLATANLVRVQKLLADRVGNDLFMYTITLDPENDTPEVLKKYAENFGVGKGWTFLTGKPKDIEFLRHRIGFSWADPKIDSQRAFHTGNLRYGNEPHMVWGAVPTLAKPTWIKECILFADWPNQDAHA